MKSIRYDKTSSNGLADLTPSITQICENSKSPGYVDIISFGFPCQDISQANPKGQGLEGEKSGLWYDGWRIIRRVRPKIIIIENSPILLHKGLRTILGQLASAGYDAEWKVISCKRFGLPHLRKRLFIVAYSHKVRRKKTDRIQSTFAGKVISTEAERKQLLQSEFNGNRSWFDWDKTIRSVSHLDDGYPKTFFMDYWQQRGIQSARGLLRGYSAVSKKRSRGKVKKSLAF